MRAEVLELARLFLRLGTLGFGGPAAHIALMRDEVVARRHWMSEREFLDLVAATNLIPGPNSTELALHIGIRRAGWPGLLVAGACFILPAAILVGALAVMYVEYGSTPQAAWLMRGVNPVVLAIVVHALWQLATAALTRVSLVLVGAAACVLAAMGVNELALLAGAALVVSLGRAGARVRGWTASVAAMAGASMSAATHALAAGVAMPVTLERLTLFFLKVGSVLFGSGYVLLAFLRADLVERWHWLTDQQLLDAIAVGQFTPGPLFTTATFIGYILAGTPGAVLSTAAIFAPAFVFVALTHRMVPRLRQSPTAAAFLDGVTVASLALMAVVTLRLAAHAVVDVPTAAIAGVALVLLLTIKPNATWLVVAGAVGGWLLR